MPPACHACGAPLSPGSSPGGLCPACLLAQALSEPGDSDRLDELGPSEMAPGTMFGPFRIERVLGKGGMSTVYAAYEAALDRVVALKVLPREFLHDETFALRFRQEARVVAGLEHPHIVPLYASGIDAGVPWMSMRLMTGGSLGSLLEAGRLGIERAVEILSSVAASLEYAHARGVVHRDVKPSNILLDGAGHVCLGDFGLAHLLTGSAVHTRTGLIAGTPHYMAPEQGLGKKVDHRADIYSLGVVAYEMLAGRPPYDGDSPVAVLMKHASEPFPVPPRDIVPPAMVPVLRTVLAKDPGDRWPTPMAFVNALDQAGTGPTRTGTFSTAAMWAGGLALAAALAVLVLLTQTTFWRTAEPPEPLPSIVLNPVSPLPEGGTPWLPEKPSAPAPDSRKQPAAVGPEPVQATPDQTSERPEPSVSQPPSSGGDTAATTEGVTTGGAGPPGGDVEPHPEPPSTNNASPGRTEPVPPPRQEDKEPVLIREVKPTYPALAVAAQMEGDVVLGFVVRRDGSVADVEVLRSVHRLLDNAAVAAVRQYGYKPGLRNGAPDAFRVQVTVSFKLQ